MSKGKKPYYYQEYQEIATACGLNLKMSLERSVMTGTIDGFGIILYPEKESKPMTLTAVFGVTDGPEVRDFKGLQKKISVIDKISMKGHRLVVSFKNLKKGVAGSVNEMLRSLVAELKALGYASGCEVCGCRVETKAYLRGEDTHTIMCDTCAESVRQGAAADEEKGVLKNENVFLGIIGALIGAVIGGYVIFIIGAGGYVAVIGGIVLGIATVSLYKKMAGKLTILSVIICVIIMLLTVYICNQAVWAYTLLKEGGGEEAGYTFAMCYNMIPLLIKGKLIPADDYYFSLFKRLLYTAAGAGGTVVAVFRSYKLRNRLELLH